MGKSNFLRENILWSRREKWEEVTRAKDTENRSHPESASVSKSSPLGPGTQVWSPRCPEKDLVTGGEHRVDGQPLVTAQQTMQNDILSNTPLALFFLSHVGA